MNDQDGIIGGDAGSFDIKSFISEQVKDVDKELEGPRYVPKATIRTAAAQPPVKEGDSDNGEEDNEDEDKNESPEDEGDEDKVYAVKDQQAGQDAEGNVTQRLKEIERLFNEFRAGKSGVKIAAAPAKQATLDWSKITERDVYDLSVPIEAIDQSIPDASYLPLRDPDYVARLCSTHKRVMALRKAQGYTYVVKEDIDTSQFMGLDIEPDENGQYVYGDCVYMKIHKKKYFGKMRANQIKSSAMINSAKAHQIGKAQVAAQYENDFQIADAYRDYTNKNKLEVYVPGEV